MANEVTIAVSLGISKSGVTAARAKTVQRDLTGSHQISQVQTIGSSAELIVFGDLGNVAHVALHNLGDTNAVTISLDSGATDVVCVLAPGDIAYLPGSASTLYAKTATGSSDLAVVACET